MKFYKAPAKVKLITFDLDDTLYENYAVIRAAEHWLAAQLTAHYDLPECCLSFDFWRPFKDRVSREQPQVAHDVTALRATALQLAFESLKKPLQGGMEEALYWVRQFVVRRSEQVKVPPQSHELLKTLGKCCPLAIVSNGNSDATITGLAGYFARDFRPQVGGDRSKPCPDLFLKAAREFKVETSEILHVGDDPITDVAGPIKAGCQCAWLKGGIVGECLGLVGLRALPTVEISSPSQLLALLPAFGLQVSHG